MRKERATHASMRVGSYESRGYTPTLLSICGWKACISTTSSSITPCSNEDSLWADRLIMCGVGGTEDVVGPSRDEVDFLPSPFKKPVVSLLSFFFPLKIPGAFGCARVRADGK